MGKHPNKRDAAAEVVVVEQEACLQGVVVSDGLVEVCGRAVLEYSLDVLEKAGALDILVLCNEANAGAVADAVGSRGRVLEFRGCGSAGDVLRELDQRGVVKSDPFIMVSGSSACAIDGLEKVVAAHAERKKKNPEATLTVVLREGGRRAAERIRPTLKDDLVVAYEADTRRVVAWHDPDSWSTACVELPLKVLGGGAVEVRRDLVDTGVDVCSPEVLWRYSENFDYQNRRDFVANEVANLELGQRAHAYVLEGPGYAYGARLEDPRGIDAVAQDVLGGWAGPPPPIGRRPRNAIVVASFVSPTTIVGDGCEISRSVIGEDVVLGDGAKLSHAHVASGCRVGNRVHITRAILGRGVVVGDDAVVPRGCVLAHGVAPGTILAEYTRLPGPEEEEDDDIANLRATAPGGDPELERRKADLWRDDWGDDDRGEEEEEEEENPPAESWSTASNLFAKTVRDMVISGYKAGSPVDSMLMELNCYKLSENRTFLDAAPAALDAVLAIAFEPLAPGASTMALVRALKNQIDHWTPLLAKLVGDDPDDQAHSLSSLATDLAHVHAPLANPDVFRATLQLLYDADVLTDEAILEFAALNANNPLVASPQVASFLAWLEEEDEDDDEASSSAS
ncbi:hypothetical protein CTAYLR_005794 [Chrysophaeum taylorii]|uniref:Translation initiation factor eIF2B subunit epsilon n=1 Tax=Chrysophaeum taylorii TaxID=2483200 RepID=A0AAD7XQT0_9STRA|nr:hypothetical protein CTAYLR_005794 [Chrysophaeum taylorii]